MSGCTPAIPPELLSEDAHLIAALLAIGDNARLCHGTAAYRHAIIPAPPLEIHLTSPRCLVAPDGIVLHRCTTLRPTDITTIGRFPATSVARTLLDVAVTYHVGPLQRALQEAEFVHDIRPEDVLATLRRGHPGSANLRAALEKHVPGYGKAKQQLERDFRALLVRYRIELPLRNRRIGPYVVDCLWPEARLVAELDGRQHERLHQRTVDCDRDLYLRARGYEVVRYTWKQVHDAADAVVADLLRLLAVPNRAHPRG